MLVSHIPVAGRNPTKEEMPAEKIHDLYEFMRQLSVSMSSEYTRIQMRATEDPGTAGDQGEENWAKLLREWLPRTYEVVTKGRIINARGETSPQIDVLVLNSAYPRKLLESKIFLGAGVLAAFECKTTLKASHLRAAVRKGVQIKNLYFPRTGTPFQEIHSPIVYGILAHSHAWKGKNSTPEQHIQRTVWEAESQAVDHPRSQLDVLCVSDLGTWTSWKQLEWNARSIHSGPSVHSTFMGRIQKEQRAKHVTPIGGLISYLSKRLAWEDPSLRGLAEYYTRINLAGSGGGPTRIWPSEIFSDRIHWDRPRHVGPRDQWDEWASIFY